MVGTIAHGHWRDRTRKMWFFHELYWLHNCVFMLSFLLCHLFFRQITSNHYGHNGIHILGEWNKASSLKRQVWVVSLTCGGWHILVFEQLFYHTQVLDQNFSFHGARGYGQEHLQLFNDNSLYKVCKESCTHRQQCVQTVANRNLLFNAILHLCPPLTHFQNTQDITLCNYKQLPPSGNVTYCGDFV